MKSKKKAKTQTKSKTRSKTKSHARAKPRTSHPGKIDSISRPDVTVNPSINSCQEIEVGDIGGFGSTQELEEHERRCGEQATEFCASCGKNLCHNHYDLLHREHDHSSQNLSVTQA